MKQITLLPADIYKVINKYEDVRFEYSIYGDNIMLHIYLKEEEVNPLLVFIVTEEMYHMIKNIH